MNKSKAFTLIELLVVISIIALLMSMLMPMLGKAKQLAQATSCQSNLKQWAVIWSMYTTEYNDWFGAGYMSAGRQPEELYWMEALENYYRTEEIFTCPLATKNFSEGGRLPFMAWGGSAPDGHTDMTNAFRKGSYGVNNWIYNPPLRYKNLFGTSTSLNWRTPSVKGATYVPMFVECFWSWCRPTFTSDPPIYDGDFLDWAPLGMKSVCLNRHEGAINSAFLDFSVRKVGLKELWELSWHKKWNENGDPPPIWPKWMRNFKDYRVH